MYVKLSVLVRPSEGCVIDYVRKNTTIPVPIVIDNVTIDGVTALVLSSTSRRKRSSRSRRIGPLPRASEETEPPNIRFAVSVEVSTFSFRKCLWLEQHTRTLRTNRYGLQASGSMAFRH